MTNNLNGWQPIETAPKNGARIILANKREVDIAHWSSSVWISQKQEDGTCGAWCVFDCRSDSEAFVAPTHWMPLPQLPKEEVKND